MKKIITNKLVKNCLILITTLFGIELIFNAVENIPIWDWSTLRVFIGITTFSLFISIILSFCKKWIANTITFLIVAIASIYAVAQAGFLNFLGVYISINTSSQLGAVKEYVRDYISSFKVNFYLIFIPLILLIVYKVLESRIFKKREGMIHPNKEIWISRGVSAGLVILLSVCYVLTLNVKFMQNEIQLISTKALFKNPSNPNIAVNQFGVEMFGILDIKTAIFPTDDSNTVVEFENLNKKEEVTDYTRKIDDYAWKQVAANETNANYKTLNNYFMSRSITSKNEYTGMFEGKNLIVIMMESVNNILLDETYYPNFAKIMNEGWFWENAYSPRNSCSTGNNEMTGMISLYSINRTCTANAYKYNKYEESIFGIFNKANYTTTSYHDYTEKYYFRSTIHKNMGSSRYYGVTDLGISYNDEYKEWPSDVLLMQKSSEIFTQNTPFMAWITTVSPHQPYYEDSQLSKIYYDSLKETGYPSNVKRYMSKLKVMDDSLGELLKILEEKGILDDTVIVLYADHYPYGLATSDLKKVLGDSISSYNEIDRTPFAIYNSQMTPKRFTEYTTYANIVPTIANLFNLDYDPRVYVGQDLLSSDYENIIVFADGSWQTPIGYYYASSGRISYFGDETYTNEEILAINADVNNKMKYSNLAIRTNYFNHLYTEMEKYSKVTETEENTES